MLNNICIEGKTISSKQKLENIMRLLFYTMSWLLAGEGEGHGCFAHHCTATCMENMDENRYFSPK